MKTKAKKPTLDELIVEVRQLRSAVISLVGRDPEGEYRPEFVKKVLKSAKEPATRKFVDAKTFLKEVEKHGK